MPKLLFLNNDVPFDLAFFLIKFDYSETYFIANSFALTLIISFGLNFLEYPFWFKKTKNT
jgi:hypothetical protein